MRRPASCVIFVIFGPAFLPLPLRRRHPQHRDVLAQRRHRLRIFRHVEIAADDGEIGLAFGQRLRARRGAVGLHRAQPDVTVRLGKGLRQRLDDLDVIAVGGADCDPQGHRPHRKVIGARDRADDGKDARQRDEHQLALRRTRRRRRRRLDKVEASGHRSGKQSFEVQFHLADTVRPDIVANFLPARGYICVMVTGRVRAGFAALLWHGSGGAVRC